MAERHEDIRVRLAQQPRGGRPFADVALQSGWDARAHDQNIRSGSDGRSEQLVEPPRQLRGIRLGARTESRDNAAAAVDEVLVEGPFRLSADAVRARYSAFAPSPSTCVLENIG